MRLLDIYAVNCGAKIDKPFILDSYFPVGCPKYITFQAQSKAEAKDYDYWQDVLNIITPILDKHDIKVIQLGGLNEMPYQRVIDLRGQTTSNQLAYVIKGSLLHFGPDSFCKHLASHYDVPLVALYSSNFSAVSGPHFGSPDKQILFDCFKRTDTGKPSFALTENPKSINLVHPEEIANSIFKLLEINFTAPFNTVFTGHRYSSKIIRECIPNKLIAVNNVDAPIEIRADLHYDEKILAFLLSNLRKAVIVTDKTIPIPFLKAFKAHIALIVYRVTENDDPAFVRQLLQLPLNVLLVSKLSDEQIQAKRIHYYDIGTIVALNKTDIATVDKLRADVDKLYYRSNKLVASDGKIFPSHAAVEANKPLQFDHEYSKVIDCPRFWEDLDFYTIVKRTDL